MFRKEETIHALLYILNKIGICSMHKAFKILYFADQRHLAKFGRSITGDSYIAMQFGPVPSYLYDILKAVRGDSFFAPQAVEFKKLIAFHNKYSLIAREKADLDYLSITDKDCLDVYIEKCKDLNFSQITSLSHGYAWENTHPNRSISIKDILREVDESEEYANYIEQKINMESCLS